MIVGLGIELVDVGRFEAALARFGDRLRERVFTPAERAYAARKRRDAHSLAARFAAKSAARRALGLRRVGWREVEVVRERGSAPGLRLHGAADAAARALGVTDVTLSLTHDARWCLGQVVLQRGAR